jgi:hypothetical protein
MRVEKERTSRKSLPANIGQDLFERIDLVRKPDVRAVAISGLERPTDDQKQDQHRDHKEYYFFQTVLSSSLHALLTPFATRQP